MLRSLLETWPAEITLVPYSGVQFLDFGFSIDAISGGSAQFSERIQAKREDGTDVWRIYPHSGDDDADAAIPEPNDPEEEDYSISKTKALEPFLMKWTPIPLLRIGHGKGPGGTELYDKGPTTWARLYLLELDERDPKTDHTHRAILAIDTDLDEEEVEALDDADEESSDGHFLTPSPKDAVDERNFRLVCDVRQMGWFLRHSVIEEDGTEFDVQKWVDDWLLDQFMALKRAQRPNREVRAEDLPYKFEHWARYIAMLRLLEEAIDRPKIRLLDTVTQNGGANEQRYQCVEVDLVLDVGNSRTCGILVESFPDDTRGIDLNNSYVLALRDLSRPERLHQEPFESRVEFAQADFGPEYIARRSNREKPAFLWPSLMRVGPEAAAMVQSSRGNETLSGLSSPKRYLWDSDPVMQDWRFRNWSSRDSLPLVARSAFRFLNEAGDVIEQVVHEEADKLRERNKTSKSPAIRPRFSRSALYGFLISELTTHALVQINDPAGRATRKQSNLPRRLRNIILTLPSATPVQEQSIMRSRAEGAIRLAWAIRDWSAIKSSTCEPPKVIVEWDEASCTQLVWLFDQITQRFGGQIDDFFDLAGRRRSRARAGRKPSRAKPSAASGPSLRLGCLDIGGGTTDLMVTTFFGEDNRAIRPVQNVREGFRLAGDDLVGAVVGRLVLAQLRDRITEAGASYVDEFLVELFGGDFGEFEEQTRQKRRQFALQVLSPVALAFLSAYETMSFDEVRTLEMRSIVGTRPGDPADDEDIDQNPNLAIADEVLAYLEEVAQDRGAVGWRLADMTFEVRPGEMEDVVRGVLGPPLEAMVELVEHLDVDVLLLSGRPTRLPAVRDLVRETMAVRPDRLISMHDYKVGGWYPFRDRVSSRIGDPKTTAAVGGMLCLLAANRIVNFKLHTEEIRMRSTARYIGELEKTGLIQADRVLFSGDGTGRSGEQTAEISFRSPIHVGFRQLPHVRWMASPLYRLDFANENAKSFATPLKVVIRRREVEGTVETQQELLRMEALKEAFVVDEVEAADGASCKPSDVRMSLHTLGVDEHDYWLDTGVFEVE